MEKKPKSELKDGGPQQHLPGIIDYDSTIFLDKSYCGNVTNKDFTSTRDVAQTPPFTDLSSSPYPTTKSQNRNKEICIPLLPVFQDPYIFTD